MQPFDLLFFSKSFTHPQYNATKTDLIIKRRKPYKTLLGIPAGYKKTSKVQNKQSSTEKLIKVQMGLKS